MERLCLNAEVQSNPNLNPVTVIGVTLRLLLLERDEMCRNAKLKPKHFSKHQLTEIVPLGKKTA